jgi:hypothetical protein
MGEPMRPIYLAKKAMLMAFNEAKNSVKSKSEFGDDYI